jgi:hypothetical protein
VGVVCSSRLSSGCGDLRIIKELHQQFILLLRLRDFFVFGADVVFSQATTSGRLREARQRRRAVDTV